MEEIESVETPQTAAVDSGGTLVERGAAIEEAEIEPITIDEILDVHLYLKDYQGTLKDLLHQPDHSRG